jgi:hypothetical protein
LVFNYFFLQRLNLCIVVISIDGGVLAVKKDSISVRCYGVEWNWEGKGTGEEI